MVILNSTLKMVFNNIGHHILDVKACRTHLLGYEAGSRHARCGIDFKQVHLFAFGNDVVDTDNTRTT